MWLIVILESGPQDYLNTICSYHLLLLVEITLMVVSLQKMKFPIKDLFSKCDHIPIFLRIWSLLLNSSLIWNFVYGAVLNRWNMVSSNQMKTPIRWKWGYKKIQHTLKSCKVSIAVTGLHNKPIDFILSAWNIALDSLAKIYLFKGKGSA